MIISHIVAIAKDGGIGKDNDLLWRLPNDLKHFKQTTLGHHILMGRKNYDSIGMLLPKRTSVIVTRQEDFQLEGAHIFNDINKAINFAKEAGEEELFIVGGGEIYKQTYHLIDKLYLTTVDVVLEADTFYPEIDFTDWELIEANAYAKDEKHAFDYKIEEFKRIK